MKPIRVLVVDDSVFFRNILVQCLQMDPYIEVIAQAGDPYQARDAIIKYKPDVMTLDVEMPKMSGIDFLRKLMPQYPLPVVVISSLNGKVFDALEAGAVDFVNKPAGMDRTQLNNFVKYELITKIKIASTAKVGSLKIAKPNTVGNDIKVKGNNNSIIAIGASTGGTEAIFEVIKHFRRDIPGIVMVQHMPVGFTKMYADRLNNQCQIAVKEAQTGDKVLPGRALLAPADRQMRVIKVGDSYQVECRGTERVSGHCPSADVLFQSVAKTAGKNAIGVILTGMGGDGANGLLAMRKAGARTIGQDEESCVVYGMPKVAYDIGAVQYQLSLTGIAGKVYGLLSR
uniref:protein-glutamate methylesterase/protein-glutamine glutaminase n=1 Tax=Agathobacter sp. TaxID=2021311 RepID=UPI0040565C53